MIGSNSPLSTKRSGRRLCWEISEGTPIPVTLGVVLGIKAEEVLELFVPKFGKLFL
jgi:hypothetical protein